MRTDFVTHLPADAAPATAEVVNGTAASLTDYRIQWLTFAMIVLVLIIGVAWLCWRRFIKEHETGANLRFWSYIAAAIALVGGAGHVIFTAIGPGERWLPTFDAVTIIWVGVAIVALLLPDISEFTVAGVSLKRGEIADLSIAAVSDTAELLKNWSASLNGLLAAFDHGDVTAVQAESQLSQFFQLRSYEALEWLAGDKEERRLSVWLYDQANNDLFFFFSNEIKDDETVAYRFPFGKGIVGAVYRDHRTWNERNAPTLPVYETIRTTPTRYRGILCIPIDYGSARYGVLSIDRQKGTAFRCQRCRRHDRVSRRLWHGARKSKRPPITVGSRMKFRDRKRFDAVDSLRLAAEQLFKPFTLRAGRTGWLHRAHRGPLDGQRGDAPQRLDVLCIRHAAGGARLWVDAHCAVPVTLIDSSLHATRKPACEQAA